MEENRNINLKKLIVFLVILGIILSYISNVFTLKQYGLGPNVNILMNPYILCERPDGFYNKKEDTLDVIFVGSSNIHCNVNPNIIWNQYGITSYNFSSDQQELGTSYFYLKQAFKTQSPSVVVVDVMDGGNTDEITDLAAHFAFDHMKFDEVKVEGILSRTKKSRLEMFFPLITYHERWKELKKEDFLYKKNGKNVLNGSFLYMLTGGLEEPILPEIIPEMELSEKTKYWIDAIVELCEKNNCECIFIKTPYAFYEEGIFAYFEAVSKYCDEKNISFLYLNKMADEIGIDFVTDYADTVHMNWEGQKKLSSFLGNFLATKYEIKDKRNDEEYDEWNEDYKVMMEYVDNFDELYFK